MKALKLATVLLLGAAATTTTPAFTAAAQVNQMDAEINIIPDKVTKTDKGVRIAICLVGIPETTECINGIDLVIGTKLVKATAVDGIEFEQRFTFEDTGVQTIDVDFPFNGTIPKTATLRFHTDSGDITAPARQ